MINVTKSYLPDLDEFYGYLQGIWQRNTLTNYGPLVQELEQKLKSFLGVKHLFLVSNGTIALQVAIKGLELRGEIITTPFSYVATTSSIVWEGCKPVYVDIDPETLCMNAALVEKAITPDTVAILATHVYGIPCDVKALKSIAEKYNLKLIYDAAHAFGVKYEQESILTYGDVSAMSFHATKLFHTVEGGCIITQNDKVAKKLSYMTNFGHDGPNNFVGLGINAKNSELHAAMGLCVLPKVRTIINKRKIVSSMYDILLKELDLQRPVVNENVEYNFSYYPVVFPTNEKLLEVLEVLRENGINARRYFYPSLNSLSYVDQTRMCVSESISSRVLCLPLYPDLEKESIYLISNLIKSRF